MKIIQKPDGSCDIVFNWKERILLFRRGKLYLKPEALRHFGNTLMKIVIEWNQNFDKSTSLIQSFNDSKIDAE